MGGIRGTVLMDIDIENRNPYSGQQPKELFDFKIRAKGTNLKVAYQFFKDCYKKAISKGQTHLGLGYSEDGHPAVIVYDFGHIIGTMEVVTLEIDVLSHRMGS